MPAVGTDRWVPGPLLHKTGPVSGQVDLNDGTCVIRRHADQLCPYNDEYYPVTSQPNNEQLPEVQPEPERRYRRI